MFLYACSDSADPPAPIPPKTFQLTLAATGSTAAGSAASNRGGVACVVGFGAGGVTTSGTCTAVVDSGVVVAVTATPSPGGAAAWTGCDAPLTDSPLTCQVTMTSDRAVNVAFSAPPSTFALSVQGGANGNGNVTSVPAGIACAITAGAAGGGCNASFADSTSVTLTATA